MQEKKNNKKGFQVFNFIATLLSALCLYDIQYWNFSIFYLIIIHLINASLEEYFISLLFGRMEESELVKYKNVVIENNGDRGGIGGIFRSVFLPRGYPQSVSKDYMQYQV